MKQFTAKITAICTLLFALSSAQAQVFFTEQFAGPGFPTGWTTADPSPNNVLWERCTDTITNCHADLGYPFFEGVDKGNGFMILDSDGAGDLAQAHVSQLTSPAINCTGKNEVYAVFDNQIGVFDYSADDNAVLRVSTDLTTWTEFKLFEGVTGETPAERFSDNPFIAGVDISAVAGDQATVYLQWQWTGDYEYWWILDNVRLTTIDPFPNNLKISAFWYPVSSYRTPESQIGADTFGFSADVANRGSAPQTNVKLYAYVYDAPGGALGDLLFVDSVSTDLIAIGDTAFLEIANEFAPELPQGIYAVAYEVVSDSVDQRPADNFDGDYFEVTDFYFAKENGPQIGYRPQTGGDWAVGNYYRMGHPTMEKYQAVGAEFAFATNADELPVIDVTADLALYKINDDVAEDFSNFEGDGSSMTQLGIGFYSAPDDIMDYDLQTAEIYDFDSGEVGVELDPNGRYILAMAYSGANNVTFHAFNTNVQAYFISTLLNVDDEWGGNFAGNPNPVLRMYLDLVSKTDDKPLPESTLSVFPNPTKDVVNLDIKFDQPTDITITIADVNGRVIRTENRADVTNQLVTYQLENLNAGIYLARIATEEGTRTLRFAIQH